MEEKHKISNIGHTFNEIVEIIEGSMIFYVLIIEIGEMEGSNRCKKRAMVLGKRRV